jgi:hypothetical protein
MSDALGSGGADAVPDWLDGPLRAVLRDLVPPAPVQLALRWEPPRHDELGTLWCTEASEPPTTFGVSVFPQAEPEDLQVLLAEHLQDELSETSGAWAQARPACPGHGHPASPEVVDGVAVWRCPKDGRVLAPVGALAP